MSYYLICPEGYPLVNGRARTAHYDDLETALWNANSMQRRGFPVQLIFGTPVYFTVKDPVKVETTGA